MTQYRVMLVTVDTAEINWRTVDQHFSIFDLHHPEADLTLFDFQKLTAGILKLDRQAIQVGMLPIPFLRVENFSRQFEGEFLPRVHLRPGSYIPPCWL